MNFIEQRQLKKSPFSKWQPRINLVRECLKSFLFRGFWMSQEFTEANLELHWKPFAIYFAGEARQPGGPDGKMTGHYEDEFFIFCQLRFQYLRVMPVILSRRGTFTRKLRWEDGCTSREIALNSLTTEVSVSSCNDGNILSARSGWLYVTRTFFAIIVSTFSCNGLNISS